MIQLPPEIWMKIAHQGAIPRRPAREFLSSTQPPDTLHEYPTVYENTSGEDLLRLCTISSLSRVNRHLRSIFYGECPSDCHVVTEANIKDTRSRLAALSPSKIRIRHLMIVLCSSPCGHVGDTYSDIARELYADLAAIVGHLSRLDIITLSVTRDKCWHCSRLEYIPEYVVDAFDERRQFYTALLKADITRLSLLEGAHSILPQRELTDLLVECESLRIVAFGHRFIDHFWRSTSEYTALLQYPTPRLVRGKLQYLALPACPPTITRELILLAERLTFSSSHAGSLVNQDLGSLKQATLLHSSYQNLNIHSAIRAFQGYNLQRLCIAAPLPVLLTLGPMLPHLEILILVVVTQTEELKLPPPESLPWPRLEKLINVLVSSGHSQRFQSVQFVQPELARRLREEVGKRRSIRAVIKESGIEILDEQGSSLVPGESNLS